MQDRVTVTEVNDFLAAGRRQLAGGNKRFDLSALTHVDSTVLAALLALSREAKGDCQFENPSANLTKLADLYGVESLLFGKPR